MRMILVDKALQSIKPPSEGRLEIADLRCAGLAYRITANGARSWCWRFRDPRTGKTTRATIGSYPAVPLAKARARAEALRREVEAGTNPVAAKRQAREEAETKTFAALAERYLTEHARRKNRLRTVDVNERSLRLHVLPGWGDRPYSDIARRDVIALAEKLVTAGKPALANRTQALISSIYSYAIDADLVQANPAARLRKRGVERRKTRVLSDDEIRLFWRCAVRPPVSRPVGLALRLALLTGMRAGEAAGLARAELESLDKPEHAAIALPGKRTKNGRDHYVPLSPLAVGTVKEVLALAGDSHAIGVEGHALAVAMRRMTDTLPDEPGVDTWKADPPTPHDLRRTCATRMSALGTPGEDVSAVLGHAPQHITKQVYDKYERVREKRAALNAWALALGRILDPKAEIVRMQGGRRW